MKRSFSSKSSQSQYLQLPLINLNPSNYKEVQSHERGVSAASSAFIQCRVGSVKPQRQSKTPDISVTKLKILEMRNKIEEEFNNCLNRKEILDIVDAERLKQALTFPKENDLKLFITEQRNKIISERKILKKKKQQERLFKENNV